MTDRSLHDGLHALVADEPPLRTDITPVVHEGARLRRRRRIGYAVGALGLTGVVAAAVAVVSHDDRTELGTVAVAPFAPVEIPNDELPLTVQQDSVAGLDPKQRAIADTIMAASPDGYAFQLGPDRWDGNSNVEGVANDGTGGGRLLLGVSKPVGSQQVHPCEDSEFVQGGSCTERTLTDGSVLTLRGIVDYKGIKTIEVVLTHPDGSGVNAEAGNFVLDWPLPTVITAEDKRNLVEPSRTDPVYTVDQLAKVVLAVDDVTR